MYLTDTQGICRAVTSAPDSTRQAVAEALRQRSGERSPWARFRPPFEVALTFRQLLLLLLQAPNCRTAGQPRGRPLETLHILSRYEVPPAVGKMRRSRTERELDRRRRRLRKRLAHSERPPTGRGRG